MKVYKLKKIAKKSGYKMLTMTSMLGLLVGSGYVSSYKYTSEGTDGDDEMTGTSHRNQFYGSLGADKIDGLEGIDTVDYGKSPSAVEVDLLGGVGKGGHAEGDVLTSIEELYGSAFDDILIGNAENNWLYGNDGDDVIDGKQGNDLLIGGAGADKLDGGEGVDGINYYASKIGVHANLLTGMGIGGDAEGDTYLNIEDIRGSKFDDVLTGDDGVNNISGEGGADVIHGLGGNDLLYDTGEGSQIYGGDGDDSIVAGADAMISGGNGVDNVIYSGYRDYQFEILKADNKIVINVIDQYYGFDELRYKQTFDSIEEYTISIIGQAEKIVDIKTIWGELSAVDQASFGDVEANFLTWLGDDAGYNYDGL